METVFRILDATLRAKSLSGHTDAILASESSTLKMASISSRLESPLFGIYLEDACATSFGGEGEGGGSGVLPPPPRMRKKNYPQLSESRCPKNGALGTEHSHDFRH